MSSPIRIRPPDIDFALVAKAIDYYDGHGFKYVEVPYVVTAAALNITNFKGFKDTSAGPVASGEQSFLQLILDETIACDSSYCCATPCVRLGDGDTDARKMSYDQFFKVELFRYLGFRNTDEFWGSDPVENDKISQRWLTDVVHVQTAALTFMRQYRGDLRTLSTRDLVRNCSTNNTLDIVTDDNIELGSYGVRYHKNIGVWVFGTGLALPRFNLPFRRKHED